CGADCRNPNAAPFRAAGRVALGLLSGSIRGRIARLVLLRKAVAILTLAFLVSGRGARGQGWMDLLAGEPVSQTALLSDLRRVRVIYLGEKHTARSHHQVEAQLLSQLVAGEEPLSLFLEALASKDEPILARFQAGELSFEEFAREIDWPRKWSNYQDYRGLCLLAREKRVRIFGLDGPAPLFHRIARQGWQSIPTAERRRLRLDHVRFDPNYQRLLQLFLPIHPGMRHAWLRQAAEAQEVRDDWMAQRIVRAVRENGRKNGRALVVCGAGHLRFGLGLPEHVGWRFPLPRRILLLAPPPEKRGDSGLSRAGSPGHALSVPHSALEFVDRPLADYLWLPSQSLRPQREPCPLEGSPWDVCREGPIGSRGTGHRLPPKKRAANGATRLTRPHPADVVDQRHRPHELVGLAIENQHPGTELLMPPARQRNRMAHDFRDSVRLDEDAFRSDRGNGTAERGFHLPQVHARSNPVSPDVDRPDFRGPGPGGG
ncbi:MAG: ChaN family lipoprotein, partial [Methylacidiphilaceae bacterium]|nr:ChaN family lipoprotein [Candidatus Methylacidiphilaceae bacterium]